MKMSWLKTHSFLINSEGTMSQRKLVLGFTLQNRFKFLPEPHHASTIKTLRKSENGHDNYRCDNISTSSSQASNSKW